MSKPKVAIFEFTDCEGCEVEIISLREKLLVLENRVDIVNWRLGQENNQPGPYDLTIIEGTPITQNEVDRLKKLREESKVLIGLGSCATLGGIPAIIDTKKRKEFYKKIYGAKYKPRGIDALPLATYVKVDFLIHGCPVNNQEVVRIVSELLAGRRPQYRGYSVCFECKQAGNKCRLLNNLPAGKAGKPCLGPITQGGCKAVCLSGGSPCYGCFGIREEAEVKNLLKILNKITNQEEIDRYFSMFLSRVKK